MQRRIGACEKRLSAIADTPIKERISPGAMRFHAIWEGEGVSRLGRVTAKRTAQEVVVGPFGKLAIETAPEIGC